jgi:hypothetical protein
VSCALAPDALTSAAAAGRIIASPNATTEKHNSMATIVVAQNISVCLISSSPFWLCDVRGPLAPKPHEWALATQINGQRRAHFCPVTPYKLKVTEVL